MKILYIYPHPDDESFGPASVMHMQQSQGHEVYLLTLTEGGATRQRHKYNLSIEAMGKVRVAEMQDVEKVLRLTGMTILDLPDSGLKEMDPADIEAVIEEHILKIQPDVLVTYPVHGISGFHDHLITHAAVKSVFCRMRSKGTGARRLAFIALNEAQAALGKHFRLNCSTPDEIDCVVTVGEEDHQALHKALDCYKTFTETINASGVREILTREMSFEFFQENYNPPVQDLFAGL
ncbi:MAG: PIG-L family deacetylase [Ignavibacteriales bacterium]|nr:MAG: PIG-L family deacetylase [Ignavibacteriales bacterium]